jgi:carboxypeptidase Taq
VRQLSQPFAILPCNNNSRHQAWVKARQASDFSQFAPVLQEWVDLRREKARLVDPSRPVYDILLDDYEKGVTAARLDEIFGQVKAGLVPLLADLRARGKAPSDAWLKGDYDTKKQAELCHKIAVALGFSLDSGRLDVSVHPFTGGAHPTDVRMTTRFKQEDLTEGITGAIHETGHALYEQGRNLEYDGLPVNQALGMGVHESQSLLWERMVGLSRPFAAYLLPLMREYFPQLPKEQTPEDLYAALNIIKEPSMIRVESDEVTYPLHIILRYELEKALVEGSIEVKDLPRLWNEKMKEYLGCEPESDARGVLQDVHWSAGLFGYFPTYSLGAMYATQIFKAAEKELPGLADDIAAGKFERLKGWLNEKIHKVGSLPTSGDELMVAVTGAPLQPQVFLDYLKDKYSALYQL